MKAFDLRPALLVLMVSVSGCAVPFTQGGLLGPPTPAQILAKPSASGIKDMHLKISGKSDTGSAISGEGVMILNPKRATHFTYSVNFGAIPITGEDIEVDGQDYTRVGSGKWDQKSATDSSKSGAWADGKNPTLLGEETVAGDKAWHVKATDSAGTDFELWVREKDGYPLKYVGGGSAALTMEFSNFNSGANITAPPADEIKPKPIAATAAVGQAGNLNGARVTVISQQKNYLPANQFERPSSGNQYLAIEVLYENTGKDKVSYNPYDWKLKDGTGAEYKQGYASKNPELNSGDLVPGDKVRGWIVFEVPANASGLKANVTLGGDSLSVSL